MARNQNHSMVAIFSGILAIAMNVVNIIYCADVLTNRFNCHSMVVELIKGSRYFEAVIYHQYVYDYSCFSPVKLPPPITSSELVYVFSIALLALSCVHLLSIIPFFLSFRRRFECTFLVSTSTYTYVLLGFVVIGVEIALSVNFYVDYSTLNDRIDRHYAGYPDNYAEDILRIGALYMIWITMKGFVAPILYTLLALQLLYYTHRFIISKNHEVEPPHSIHNRGVINAFDEAKNEDQWQFQPESSSNFVPGVLDSTHSSPYRLEHRGPASTGRPFTYLAPDPSQPLSNTRSRSQESPLPVPIPVPDYSPQPILKSALRVPYA